MEQALRRQGRTEIGLAPRLRALRAATPPLPGATPAARQSRFRGAPRIGSTGLQPFSQPATPILAACANDECEKWI
ncbi:hypothetical protein EJP67_16930 [Variovorax guangxiensis]|uniref:Uncharacterized protein n=1 Tax=Variovorax guangxiensis TaxID=1775474 RepID=A0A433MM73_9BURK|nr:hypothetical protein EJP67_16930 [Variovorax guangxiensis]